VRRPGRKAEAFLLYGMLTALSELEGGSRLLQRVADIEARRVSQGSSN
jgi:hypothetical protein